LTAGKAGEKGAICPAITTVPGIVELLVLVVRWRGKDGNVPTTIINFLNTFYKRRSLGRER